MLSGTRLCLLAVVVCGVTPGSGSMGRTAVDGVPGIRIVERPRKLEQLVGDYDRERQQPTRNLTARRFKLDATDLGVPFRHKGRTWLVFGDTYGPRGGDAIAWTASRSPEKGLDLTFIHDETGTYAPIIIPGISQGGFEVPMAGVSVGGRIVLYHTTDHSPTETMGRSVVAVSDDGKTFRYLYDLSRKHFINVSVVKVRARDWPGLPQRQGEVLLLFGSGSYRRSDVRLAVQPARDVRERGALRYYAGANADGAPVWSAAEDDARPLFSHPCVGELSVTCNRFLRKWLLLYNGQDPRGILLRTADRPWGPWSDAQVLFDPWADGGYGHFMHVGAAPGQASAATDTACDPGREREWGGEYGPYQFADFATGKRGETTIYFTMSTWNPYTVVLMTARLARGDGPSPTRAAAPGATPPGKP